MLLVDSNAHAVNAAADKLSRTGGRVVAYVADMASDSAPDAICKTAVEAFGGVDILVNNAGIFRRSPSSR